MKSCKKILLTALAIFGLGLAQPIAVAMPAMVDRSLKAISTKSKPYIDTATQLLFSDPVQKIAATMNRFAYLSPETPPIKRSLFCGFFVGAPLGSFLAQYIIATLDNKKHVSPVGLIVGATSTAYLLACMGTLTYTEAAINHLKEKIKQKQPLSTYEVYKAVALSLYFYAYNRGKIKNFDRIKYNFYETTVWDHPQLNTNKKLIEGFVKCFKHAHHSYLCPTNYDAITTIINEHPSLVKKIKTVGKTYLNNNLFSDLTIKHYIEAYMQVDELDTIIDIVMNYHFPYSTELLKPYITPKRAAEIVSKYHSHYKAATPFWDYVYSIHAAHNCHTADHSALLANALCNVEQYPLTLQLYAQEPYLQILKKFIQQADSIQTKDIHTIDTLLTAIPALTNTLKEKCLRTCPTQSGWPGHIDNKAFFKEIFMHHLAQGAAHVRTETIQSINDPELTHLYQAVIQKKVRMLLPDNRHQLTGPTQQYIDQYPHLVIQKFGECLSNKALQRLSHEVITLESQEARKGHYTFLHGEPKEMHPLQYWFTKLYEIKNSVKIGDYIFTRFINETGLLNQVSHWSTRIQNAHRGNRSDIFMGHCLQDFRK